MVEGFTGREFEAAIKAGVFSKIAVVSSWSHFTVVGKGPNGTSLSLGMSKHRREPRRFLNPAAALKLLREMGATKVEVDMSQWDLELASLSMRLRPDVTARRMQARRYPELAYAGKLETIGPPNREEEKNKLAERKMMGRY